MGPIRLIGVTGILGHAYARCFPEKKKKIGYRLIVVALE